MNGWEKNDANAQRKTGADAHIGLDNAEDRYAPLFFLVENEFE
jgi:hypothetical protein